MINKHDVENRIYETNKIAQKYNLSSVQDGLKNIHRTSEEYKVRVLFVGGFSAGKSALLNRVIGRYVLEEDQAPETVVAAELYFSEEEKKIANYINGNKTVVNEDENIDIEQVQNVEIYLNSENLKCLHDYVLVDTPGFDSGIEKHNKALMQYIDRGTVYFVVVDCEKGTLSESTLNFIREVLGYTGEVAIIINKCDKKIEQELIEIKEHIRKLLLASCGREFPIICTSIFDEDVDGKIIALLEGFNSQYLYEKNMFSVINKERNAVIMALELIKEKETCETEELDSEIVKREKAKEQLLRQMEVEKQKTSKKLYSDIKETIINNIHAKLVSNVSELASAYTCGTEFFQEKVVEIVRPIIVSEIEDYSSIAYENLVKNLNLSVLENQSNTEEIGEIITSVYNKLKTLGENDNFDVPIRYSENDKDDGHGIAAYRAISSILAIVTEVVAPPLEILIVFLPDIIRLLNTLWGTSQEEQLVDAMQNKVIPQIVSKMRKELDTTLKKMELVLLDNIEQNINEIIDVENQALELIKSKKNDVQNYYETYINNIEADIELMRK